MRKCQKELLNTKYQKPYRELKDKIKEVANRILNSRMTEGIVIRNDEAGQELLKKMQALIKEKRGSRLQQRTRQNTLQGIRHREVFAGSKADAHGNVEFVDNLLARILLPLHSPGELGRTLPSAENL